jgi:hypothetical protein
MGNKEAKNNCSASIINITKYETGSQYPVPVKDPWFLQ